MLAGFTSETCVEGTGRHALEAGYHVTFIHKPLKERVTIDTRRELVRLRHVALPHDSVPPRIPRRSDS